MISREKMADLRARHRQSCEELEYVRESLRLFDLSNPAAPEKLVQLMASVEIIRRRIDADSAALEDQ